LKIETTPRDDHQVKIVAEFEPEVMEKFKRQAARKISQQARIPGFRPGKAPYDIIRRMYGDDTIVKEALELLMDDVYPDVLKAAEVEPSGPGSLDEVISNDPPKLVFIVPLVPTVELGDYQAIRKEYTPPEVSDEQIDEVIRNLRASYSTAEPVDRPVEEGDLVSVKVSGQFTHPAEGEDAEAIKENTVQMIIGENDFEVDDWPYEGFSRELIGLKENDVNEITYTYPEDDEEENLRGKEVHITATVLSVKSLHLPEVNDEFSQSLGDYPTVDALRDSIRQNLQETSTREYDTSYYNGLVDEVLKVSSVKYPPQMLQEEIDRVKHSLMHDLEDRKMDFPTYLKTLNKDEATFIEEDIKPVAIQRLERSLILDEVAQAEKVKLDPEELQQQVAGTMQYLHQTDPEITKLRGERAQNFAQGLTMETASRLLNRQVLDRLKAIATGEVEKDEAEALAAKLAKAGETEDAPQSVENAPEAVEDSQPDAPVASDQMVAATEEVEDAPTETEGEETSTEAEPEEKSDQA